MSDPLLGRPAQLSAEQGQAKRPKEDSFSLLGGNALMARLSHQRAVPGSNWTKSAVCFLRIPSTQFEFLMKGFFLPVRYFSLASLDLHTVLIPVIL